MTKENIWFGLVGLVLGLLLMNFLVPTTWRGMMGGYGNYQGGRAPETSESGPQCGPSGCSLADNFPRSGSNSGLMPIGMMGQGMMGGSSAMGNGSTLMGAADIDKAFIEEMIPHHQAAVMMATMLQAKSARPEMKQLAADIISAQAREIKLMQSWDQNWGGE